MRRRKTNPQRYARTDLLRSVRLGELGRGVYTQKDSKNQSLSPLKNKLGVLGKTISLVGGIVAGLVFIICFIRLALSGGLSFDGVRELFLSCVVLLIATVPEGLPTIVAVSLALNMIKLAKENALIKATTISKFLNV